MYVDESDTKDFLLPAEAPSHDEERELKSEHQLVSPVNGAEHEPVSPLHSAEAMPDSPSKAIPQARVKSIMQISTGGNRTADDEGFHALTKAAVSELSARLSWNVALCSLRAFSSDLMKLVPS